MKTGRKKSWLIGLSILTLSFSNIIQPVYAAAQSPEGTFQKYSADVTGDKGLEVIYVGLGADESGVFIKVQDGKSKKILASVTTEYYGVDYDTDLAFQDFNGDKKKEIILTTSEGGSGSERYCAVFTMTGGKLKVVPFKQAAIKAEVKIAQTATQFIAKPSFSKTAKTIKVDAKRYDSIEAGDVSGQFQGPDYYLKDMNKDGKADIVQEYQYYLINHGDGLGDVSVYYQYNSKEKAIVPFGFAVK